METKNNSHHKQATLKTVFLALITLFLLIPLTMVQNVIKERGETKTRVTEQVMSSYSQPQLIYTPELKSIKTDSIQSIIINDSQRYPTKLDIEANVTTNTLHRSVYDVIVYNTNVKISGTFPVTEQSLEATENVISLDITDFKGLAALPTMTYGGKEFKFERKGNGISTHFVQPQDAQVDDQIPFSFTLDLKGTDSLMFNPLGVETKLTVNSTYKHPSFQGDILPESRDIRNDGFTATWNLSSHNLDDFDYITGVKFVEPANPYQQSTRSAKYGILIIVLVFAAAFFVEFFTQKEISLIQYTVIGLSLVLFYSLLLSFSEFVAFGIAYTISLVMTLGALLFYFRAILKSKTAYWLVAFVALVYVVNFMVLQMETYALLAGSLVLFVLLCGVMYLTANINNRTIETE